MRARHPNRVSLILTLCTVLICVAWAIIAQYAGPAVIRSAYYGHSWPLFNRIVANQASHSLASFLAYWHAFAWRFLALLAGMGALAVLCVRPEFQNAFWGPEPQPVPQLASKTGGNGATSPWTVLVLAAILLAALALRLPSLGARSLSQDEIFSVFLVRQPLTAFWSIMAHSEANMALYYGILRLWIHLGQTEFALRSFSVIAAVASVGAIYSLGARAFGRRAGAIGALLLAINCFHIEYSQDARSYSLVVLLVTLSSLFLLESLHEGSRKNWTRYIVTSALAVYAHFFALLVLAAHGAFVLFLPRREAPWRRFLASGAAIAFLALPIELFLAVRGDPEHLEWVPKTSLQSIYYVFLSLAGKADRGISAPDYRAALLLVAYLVPVIAALCALGKVQGWTPESWHALFFAMWLVVPMVLTLAVSVRHPAFFERFLIICLPAFVLLATWGCARLPGTWLAAGLVCAIAGLTAPQILAYSRWQGQDWKGASKYVRANEKQGDAAVFMPYNFKLCFTYYLEGEAAQRDGTAGDQLAFPRVENSLDSFLRSLPSRYGRVWFIERNPDMVAQDGARRRFIEARLADEFTAPPEWKSFSGGLAVILFQKQGVERMSGRSVASGGKGEFPSGGDR